MLTHKGIEYAGLLYNSPEMLDLRRNLGDRISVDIRIDRSDLGSVIVLHPESGIPYRVPCVRLDYAQGLTEWQHDVCKRYSRERMQQQGDVDSWLDALLEISDIVAKEMKLGRRKGVTRQRLARWSQGKKAVPESNLVNESAPVQSLLPPVAADLQVQGSVDAAQAQTSVAGSTIVRKRFAPVFVDRANGATDE
jgi:putative transposase